MDFRTVPVQLIPTPLQNPWQAELFVLRIDLADPALGGNKWFKLFRWFMRPEVKAASILSTMGGPWSNHLIAFAAMCFQHQKKAELWIRGEEPIQKNPRLLYLERQGCALRFTGREEYRKLRTLSEHPYNQRIPFLPEGGFSAEAFEGVKEKMAPLTHGFAKVLCPAGTGTTSAGLISGAAEGTEIHVFPALGAELQIETNISTLIGHQKPEHVSYTIHKAWPAWRFGKINAELLNFIEDFEKTHRVPLDPLYTGRMMMSLMKGPGRALLDQPGKILFVHTGGLFKPPQNN